MRDKIVVATAITAIVAAAFLYARIGAESARHGLKSCADPGPAAASGLPVTGSACTW
jgi:hypothetical protein